MWCLANKFIIQIKINLFAKHYINIINLNKSDQTSRNCTEMNSKWNLDSIQNNDAASYSVMVALQILEMFKVCFRYFRYLQNGNLL